MSKKSLCETDICDRFITPAISGAGWTQAQIRREFTISAGKIVVRANVSARARPRRADYVLFRRPNIPIAVVEAKDNKHSVEAGMQQALAYAEMLDVPFAFSSNGDGFVFHDRSGGGSSIETDLKLGQFLDPEDLWDRFKAWRGITPAEEPLVETPNYSALNCKTPRYYQQLAIHNGPRQ